MRMTKIVVTMIAAAALPLAACQIEETREAKLPDVDVEGGQLPAYDAEVADVDVDTEKRTVEVPDVDVQMKEKEVAVPDVDVQWKDADIEAEKETVVRPEIETERETVTVPDVEVGRDG